MPRVREVVAIGSSCTQGDIRIAWVGLRSQRRQIGRREGTPKRKDRSGAKTPPRKKKRG